MRYLFSESYNTIRGFTRRGL